MSSVFTELSKDFTARVVAITNGYLLVPYATTRVGEGPEMKGAIFAHTPQELGDELARQMVVKALEAP